MANSTNKTIPTKLKVSEYHKQIENPSRKKEIKIIHDMMRKISHKKAVMWGNSIVGFDSYHYKYASGREGDFMKIGYSSRKQNITVYIMPGFKKYEKLMQKLGKFKTGKSCLYIKRLEDIDLNVLKNLIEESYLYMTEKYG